MRKPPSSTNRVISGSAAKIDDSPSESDTGDEDLRVHRTSLVAPAGSIPPYTRWGKPGELPGLRVSLFITCFNDTLFPETGRATVRLLERLGCQVDFPEEQTCCGQMHINSGYAREGLDLVQRFRTVFGGAEAVVSPSASCVGMVRAAARRTARPVYELSEFLVEPLGVEDVGAYFPTG